MGAAEYYLYNDDQFQANLDKAILDPKDLQQETPTETTQTVIQTPWEGVQEPLENYYKAVEEWAGREGPRVAGLAPETQQAWDLISQRAAGGSPLLRQAQETLGSSMQDVNPAMAMYGGYAGGQNIYSNPMFSLLGQTAAGGEINPYLDRMYGTAAERVGKSFQDITMPAIASRYGMAGRTGSGAESQAYEGAMGQLGQTLSGLASNIYGQGFESERGRQMQAAQALGGAYSSGVGQQLGAIGGIGDLYGQMYKGKLQAALAAPEVAGADYRDLMYLQDVGQQRQAFEQAGIDAPGQMLANYGGFLQPGLGLSGQQTSQPLYRNPLGGAVGGAMSGYQASGGSPWGALVGAGLGYMASQ